MPRIADVISLPNLPVGLIAPPGRQATYSDVSEFLKKNPGPIQKLTYLTGGGILLSIIGVITAISSKTQSLFGSMMVLAGLVLAGTGYYKSPCTNIGLPSPHTEDANDKAPVKDGTAIAKNRTDDGTVRTSTPVPKDDKRPANTRPTGGHTDAETTEPTNEELIKILLNKVKDKKYNGRERAEAAIELGKRKAEAAVHSLIKCLTDKLKTVQLACIKALGEIGGTEAFEGLRRFVKDTERGNPIRLKAVNAMREILVHLKKDHTPDI